MLLGDLHVELNMRMTVAQKTTAEIFLKELKNIATDNLDVYVEEMVGRNLLGFINAVVVKDDGSPLAATGTDWMPIEDILIIINAHLDSRTQVTSQSTLIETIRTKTQNV